MASKLPNNFDRLARFRSGTVFAHTHVFRNQTQESSEHVELDCVLRERPRLQRDLPGRCDVPAVRPLWTAVAGLDGEGRAGPALTGKRRPVDRVPAPCRQYRMVPAGLSHGMSNIARARIVSG